MLVSQRLQGVKQQAQPSHRPQAIIAPPPRNTSQVPSAVLSEVSTLKTFIIPRDNIKLEPNQSISLIPQIRNITITESKPKLNIEEE